MSANKKIVSFFTSKLDWLISFAVSRFVMEKEISKIMKISNIPNTKQQNEDEWVTKWKQLSSYVNRKFYRTFSTYIGYDINIVPDDICHNVIEPILNPKRYISAFEDKCLFDKMLWSSFNSNVTPPTYIKNINGVYFDCDYKTIESVNDVIKRIPHEVKRLIIKKSIDSSSGRGISFVYRDDNGNFIDTETKEILSDAYFKKYFEKNFVVQKVVKQSTFMDQLCKTSANTIRMAVYRSVETNEPHVINTIIRIGKDGSLVDNAHAGGMFIGIDSDGNLGKYCCNQYGEKETVFNGVDFTSNKLTVPNFDKIKSFAENVATALPHQRLLALDIMLDENNEPVLLEYNIRAFSVWLFQFTNGTGFGEYTDEIIDYCKQNITENTRISVIF